VSDLGDQGRQIRFSEAEARRWMAVVPDIGQGMEVVGKGTGQLWLSSVRLWVIPADAL
jgi:hypothetical protein